MQKPVVVYYTKQVNTKDEINYGFKFVTTAPDNTDRWLQFLPESQRPEKTDLHRLSGIFVEDSSQTIRALVLHSSYESVRVNETCFNLRLAGGDELPPKVIESLIHRLVGQLREKKAPCLALAFTGNGEHVTPEILKRVGFSYFDTMVEFKADIPFVYTPERRHRRACQDEILTFDPEHNGDYAEAIADHYNKTYGALRQPLPKRTAEKIHTLATKHAMSLYFSLDSEGEISGQAEIFYRAEANAIYGGSIIVARRRLGTDLTHRLIRKTSDAAVALGAEDFQVHVSTWNNASSRVLKAFGFREHQTLLSRYTMRLENSSHE